MLLAIDALIATLFLFLAQVLPSPYDKKPEAGILQFDRFENVPQYSVVAIGRQFGVNAYVKNIGPGKVFGVFGHQKAFVEAMPSETSDDRIVLDKFEKNLGPIRTKYLAGKINAGELAELGVGQSIWKTILTDPFTESQVTRIIEGTATLYMFAWVGWREPDGALRQAYHCQWMELPEDSPQDTPLTASWHICHRIEG